MNKKIASFLILFFLIGHVQTFAASSLRSDTIDIRKTIIDFTITDFSTKIIFAKTSLDIRSKLNNVNELAFDLEGLIVDSVYFNGLAQSFSHSNAILKIPIVSSPMQMNDTALVDIYYHGVPIADATWGGFSFIGNYGFQMGVGFNAQPHSFGRTWHPCFDNFVERSTYEFFITTEDTKVGVCNGLLLDSTTNTMNNTKRWHWKLDQEIPSYLACVAVCNYVFVKKVLVGNAGNIDAIITCEASDSNAVHGSFAHLQESYTMLENHFGTYSWPRVGYSLVPFNAGAMEHATNISIGKPFIDGTLNYETLIAHELSHHWWGDLVTCSTAGDMWLNEGFASYCEPLHTEQVYGPKAYLDEIRNNHFDVLSQAHIRDQGYRAIANMDSLFTYGMTVYSKAEDAIHTLRTYMGDQKFFSTLSSFLDAHKFQSINTLQLRDYLTNQSGLNLTDYFNNWILAPGFTHFSIDSSSTTQIGNEFHTRVYMRQRKHQSLDYYNHVPLELAFYDASMNSQIYHLDFVGRCMEFHVILPFNPTMIAIDPNSKISDAITEEEKMIKSTGTSTFTQAKCRIITKSMINTNDSTLLKAEHHWVAPDRFKNNTLFPGYVLCDSRYWKIDGINLNNINGTMRFTYDAGSGNSYLDSTWIQNTEDSIRLFYRKDATEEWQFANDSLTAGSLTDRIGNIYSKEIKAGEYTFGIKRSGYIDPIITDAPIGGCGMVTNQHDLAPLIQSSLVSIHPNPTSGNIQVSLKDNTANTVYISITNSVGQICISKEIKLSSSEFSLDISDLNSGLYYINITNSTNGVSMNEVIIKE